MGWVQILTPPHGCVILHGIQFFLDLGLVTLKKRTMAVPGLQCMQKSKSKATEQKKGFVKCACSHQLILLWGPGAA